MKKIKKLLKKCFFFAYKCICHIIPLSPNCIIFESNLGNNYAGSPRAIYEKMVALHLDSTYHCYLVLKDPSSVTIPGNGKILKRRSLSYFYNFCRAKIWISDSRMPNYLIKKKGVSYIQTWHGTPLKKLALDMEQLSMGGSTDLAKYQRNFRANTSQWDYLVSQNSYSTDIFRSCFDFHKEMLETGYPRCDVLFEKNNESEIASIKERLGLPMDKRIILYAPTWRDDEFYEKGKYKFQSPLDFHKLLDAFGKDTIFIVKYHYLVASNFDWSPYEGFVYNFSQSDDISELYLISDAMITDYSSVMFDYSILNRPIFFFCYDIENYRDNLRGFYFNLEEKAPGPISHTTEELIEQLQDYDETKYHEKMTAFRETFVSTENGHASEKIISLIQSLTKACN